MQFDARAAKLLQPGQHIMVDDCPGLRLEATASTKTWIYRFKSPVDGRMRQKKIGRWPDVSFGKAVSEWEALKKERDAGNDPALAKKAARAVEVAKAVEKRTAGYTVRRLADDYVAEHVVVNRKAKGAAEVRRMFAQNLDPIADLKAADLKRSEAFNFLQGLASTPVQALYIKQELGAAWDHAIDAARIPEESPNWWRLIMKGKLRSKGKELLGEKVGPVQRDLTETEMGDLIRWLPNFSKLVEDALVLYMWTCTRGSEILTMEAPEITEEPTGLWWTIPKAKTKNARHKDATDLRVPLIGRAEAVVRRRLQETPAGYLFRPRGGKAPHVQQKTIGSAVHYHMPYSNTHPELERPRLPVTKWGPHDLRRTGRTLLSSMGCPSDVAEAVIGHMQPGIQGVYNKYTYDKERRIWLKKLDAKLEQLAKKR